MKTNLYKERLGEGEMRYFRFLVSCIHFFKYFFRRAEGLTFCFIRDLNESVSVNERFSGKPHLLLRLLIMA